MGQHKHRILCVDDRWYLLRHRAGPSQSHTAWDNTNTEIRRPLMDLNDNNTAVVWTGVLSLSHCDRHESVSSCGISISALV
jgi:hypothetical protein